MLRSCVWCGRILSLLGMSGKNAVILLYRGMLKDCRRFNDYNIREWSMRRVRESFHENAGLSSDAEVRCCWATPKLRVQSLTFITPQIQAAFQFGKQQMEVLRRQLVIQNLYHEQNSVMDVV